MASIVSVDAIDLRFPTSLSMAGSDAVNKDVDYSAAYVVSPPTIPSCLVSGSPSPSVAEMTSAYSPPSSGADHWSA
jgi:hypothetical protein